MISKPPNHPTNKRVKVLFVCSANKQRSATAEDYFYYRYPEHEFKSAGTNHKICEQEGTTPLTEELIEWSDIVICMEEKHRTIIKKHSKTKKKILVINIPDIYKYNDPILLDLLVQHTDGLF